MLLKERNSSSSAIRRPSVAGYYYPADSTALTAAIDAFCEPISEPLHWATASSPEFLAFASAREWAGCRLLKSPPLLRSAKQSVGGDFRDTIPDMRCMSGDEAKLGGGAPEMESAIAVVLPHGSYRHSGRIIGSVLSRIAIPRRCILIGPSHTGRWNSWSVMTQGFYRTPLGDVPVDSVMAKALQDRCSFLETDAWAQRGEHAIEVLLPFLQRLGPSDLSLVPVITGSDDEETFSQFGDALARVVRMVEEPVLLVASSDLSHYESHSRMIACDQGILQAIEALNSTALARYVHEEGVWMCGCTAVCCILEAASRLGARSATTLAYGSSVEAGGDPHSCIGYAGIRVSA